MEKIMKVKDLKPAAYNPRKITDKKLEMMGESMREFGDLSGIVFNIRTKRMVGGHQRYKHLKSEWEIIKKSQKDKLGTVAVGHIKTPFGDWNYREIDWDEKKEIAANIAANKHSGEWDFPVLKDLIAEIDDGSFDIELTGFEVEELKEIFDYEFSEQLKEKEEELIPYKKSHILISFNPEKLIEIKSLLEEIIKIEGVEYEQLYL